MTTLTITRALAELKLLDKRIKSAIEQIDPLLITNQKILNESVKAKQEQFLAEAVASFQSAEALITRRDAIKAAIVQSNATTMVSIAGEEYTVAAAIEQKQAIGYRKQLLRHLQNQVSKTNYDLEVSSKEYQRRLDNYLTAQANATGKNKSDAAFVAEQTKAFSEVNEPVLIDPLKVNQLIKQLEEEIFSFESEVDYCLSESNARTTIEV